MADVFISYSRKDVAIARLLHESLQKCKIETWIDWERIPVGQKWWQEICQAIENSNVFMFIISQESIESQVCSNEISKAILHNKRIIPVLVDDVSIENVKKINPDLPQYNWIVIKKDQVYCISELESKNSDNNQIAEPILPQFKEAIEKLNVALHTNWEWVNYHTRLENDALFWERNNKSKMFLYPWERVKDTEETIFRNFQYTNKDPNPTSLQVEFIKASKSEIIINSANWYKRPKIQYGPIIDIDYVCLNCYQIHVFTPSEHLPLSEKCPSCGYIGEGYFEHDDGKRYKHEVQLLFKAH
jgi:hypothetical protein